MISHHTIATPFTCVNERANGEDGQRTSSVAALPTSLALSRSSSRGTRHAQRQQSSSPPQSAVRLQLCIVRFTVSQRTGTRFLSLSIHHQLHTEAMASIPADTLPVQLTNLNFAFAKVTIGGYLVNKLQHDASGNVIMDPAEDDRVLKNMNLTIQPGKRVLVVGGNGAGKSTLLGVLAGKHLTADDTSLIFGRDSFRDTILNQMRAFVSADWGHRAVAFAAHAMAYSADMGIDEMMVKLQAEFPERRNYLLKVLRIDPKWRLHRLSDGQRRRVQLFLALIRPSKLIILDEVLGMLDIISRENVLAFLKEETEKRGATVLLATHIFDGTDVWASDVLYIRRGTVGFYGPIEQCTQRNGQVIPMYKAVEHWLREELEEDDRIEREAGLAANGGKFDLSNAQNRAGGYASGRLGGVDVDAL